MTEPTRAARVFQALITPPLWCMARMVDLMDWLVWQADQVMARVSR